MDTEVEKIIMGVRLSDIHINIAHKLLKEQFCKLNGLESTLLQAKEVARTEEMVKNKLQIIYYHEREHWIVATTINNRREEIFVVDSVFKYIDSETKRTITILFQHTCATEKLVIRLLNSQKQKGGENCGLFAIAFATAIAYGRNPKKLKF